MIIYLFIAKQTNSNGKLVSSINTIQYFNINKSIYKHRFVLYPYALLRINNEKDIFIIVQNILNI